MLHDHIQREAIEDYNSQFPEENENVGEEVRKLKLKAMLNVK